MTCLLITFFILVKAVLNRKGQLAPDICPLALSLFSSLSSYYVYQRFNNNSKI